MTADTNELDFTKLTKSNAELWQARYGAHNEYLKLERALRDQTFADSGNWRNRTLALHSVNEHSAETAMDTVNHWRRSDPGCDILLNIHSPGGGVFAGFALFDVLREAISEGHHVTTRAYGYAASMGGILLQVGCTRQMSPYSYLMIHEVSSGVIGKLSEMSDEVELASRLQKQALEILVERSTLTAAQLKKKTDRKDWWLSATEALDYGFIDEIHDPMGELSIEVEPA